MMDIQKTPFKIKPISGFKLSPAIRHMLEKLAVFLLPVPLLLLVMGTIGIIKNDSPDSLGFISRLSQSFFNYFELHTLIFMGGALGITLIVWLITRNMWGK